MPDPRPIYTTIMHEAQERGAEVVLELLANYLAYRFPHFPETEEANLRLYFARHLTETELTLPEIADDPEVKASVEQYLADYGHETPL